MFRKEFHFRLGVLVLWNVLLRSRFVSGTWLGCYIEAQLPKLSVYSETHFSIVHSLSCLFFRTQTVF